MELADYHKADTTRVYYYTLTKDAFTRTEHRAENKAELEKAIKAGTVFSYREETNDFYFAGSRKRGSRKWSN